MSLLGPLLFQPDPLSRIFFLLVFGSRFFVSILFSFVVAGALSTVCILPGMRCIRESDQANCQKHNPKRRNQLVFHLQSLRVRRCPGCHPDRTLEGSARAAKYLGRFAVFDITHDTRKNNSNKPNRFGDQTPKSHQKWLNKYCDSPREAQERESRADEDDSGHSAGVGAEAFGQQADVAGAGQGCNQDGDGERKAV